MTADGGDRTRRRLRALRVLPHAPTSARLFTLSVVLTLAALGTTSTPTLAGWGDTATVSGTAIGTATLAAPTALSVSQACVAKPTPVRRSSGVSSASTTSPTGSLTISRPSGAAVGDVLIAGIVWQGDYSGATPTAPADWVLIRATTTSASIAAFSYYRVVGASEPGSYTWSGRAASVTGGMVAYSGVDTTNPINVSSGQSDSVPGSAIAPGVTTTRANAMLVGVFGSAAGGTTTPPNGMTSLWTGASSGGTGATIQVSTMGGEESWSTPGTTGTRVASTNGAQSVGQLIAVQPPAYPRATATWTPSTSSYATGQTYTRSPGGIVDTLGANVSTRTTPDLTSGTGYTITVRSTYQSWISAAASASFTAMSC